MNFKKVATLLGSTAVTLCLVSVTGQQAKAGQLHNGWNYSIDSFNDGYEQGIIGEQSNYELYGLAIKQTANNIFVAINAHLPLTGASASSAQDGHIGWGDMIFNFSSHKFKDTHSSDLFGIRFASNNDSGVANLGVYSAIQTKSVTGVNSGFSNFTSYNSKINQKGGTPSLGDLAADASYFQQNKSAPNSIKQGTKIGDINLIDDFSGLGLDFEEFNATGQYTFGFSFAKSLLPNGNFVAHLFEECANDGIAIEGELKDVPEPTAMAGLVLVGLTFFGRQGFKRRQGDR